ncbi:DNA-binding transcriptional MerR regulator/methanogenic corrinoid protein MtbC1 [Phycicoccus badiiscoriae]|uniref:DNA-binding transcriptional MerR regulator/methanogenic corrinoid protein MtbC1 n=1 Tax=Pedococcus badiiscoriae TaxID=642776 RepID=A0A852WBD0_9MICO|nr:DNA-binding transcriptional MerR regulator/methanogenic corrinoid protein MtbC1 [Pedococcus badiiscoriae]
MYTIGHAARLTGVPSATLRAWERRYGLVTPVRTEGGYRLYDEPGLQLLRAMGALVAAGWSPREAAEHLRADTTDTASQARQQPWDAYLSATTGAGSGGAASAAAESSGVVGQGDVRSTGAPGGGPDPDAPVAAGAWDVTALARGAAEMDPAAVGEAVDRAFAAGSFEQVVDTWLMPALQMLGDQWKAGRVDVAGEHVVSATLHRRLGAAMEAVSTAPRGPRVTVGLARGSHHELGILAFSVVLRRAGVDVVYLGADLPAQHWVAVVEHHEPAVVVLGVPTAADVLPARETVAALRAARPRLTVHVGGGAQFEVGQGTVPLGHAVAAAAHRLAEGLRTADAD